LIGVLSTSLTWITSDEIVKMRAESGAPHSFPGSTVPDLNIAGLCDSGWISSHELMFSLAAFIFVAGTVLAFYTSLAGIVQVAGFLAYYNAFESANAAVISSLPSGFGPKLALISMLLVITGMLFPVFILSKVKLTSIWRRFLTITPEKDVKQLVPLVFAAMGSVLILWGQVAWSSSAYGDATISAILFTVAGFMLLATAMFAVIVAWKTD